MSDNSPRWPSASGAPGLDFSSRKPEERAPAATHGTSPSTNGYAAPKDLHNGSTASPSSAGGVGSVNSSVNGSSPTAPPSFVPHPAASPAPADEGPAESPAEETRTVPVIPAIAGRAARAAQDWAAKARTAVAARTGSTPAVTSRTASSPAEPATEETAGTAAVEFAVSPSSTVQPGTGSSQSHGSYPESKPAAKRSVRRTRKARLRLSRLDPWSVMKTTFLFSIAFGVMMVVATFMVWSVLSGSGALESVNQLVNTLIGDEDTVFDIGEFLSMSRVLGFATVVAAIDVVILTAVATLFAFLYNLAATVMGGLEITLAED